MFLRFNKADRRILAFASLLVLLALYFLYDDGLLLNFENDSTQPVVGKISDYQNDVRYKFSRRFAWKSARRKESVRFGDSIFTGRESTATVEFKDGRSLVVQPNSLVVISNTGDQMKLDLRFGSFGGTINGCIKVMVKGKQMDVCGDKAKLDINADGNVDVLEGSAKVANQQINANDKELMAWRPKPESDFYHSENNRSLKLAWSPKKIYSRYRVQFSKDEKFKNSPSQDVTQENEISTKNYPRKGEFFVRIQAENVNGDTAALTEPVKMRFIDLPAPKILTPLTKQQLEFPTDVDGELMDKAKTEVTWDYPSKEAKYEVELSRDQDFNKVISRAPASVKTYETENLDPGNYYVRVREAQENRPWSKPTPFEVKYQGGKEQEAPKLLTKQIKYAAPSDEKPFIKWESKRQSPKYLVETSSTPDFAPEKTNSFEVSSNMAAVKVTDPGQMYFRVSPVSKKGHRGPASEVGTLSTKIESPSLNSPAPMVVMGKTPEDQGDPVSMNLSWNDLKIPGSYEIEVSKDADFKEPMKFESLSTAVSVTIPKPGEYNWRVRALNARGKPITRFSKPDKLKYDLKVPLAQPLLIEPQANMTLFFQKKASPFIWLEWKEVRQATKYKVEVSKDPGFTSIVYQGEAKSPRHLIKQSLGSGKLYWRTMAFGDDGRMSYWSEPRMMTVWTGNETLDRMPASNKRK